MWEAVPRSLWLHWVGVGHSGGYSLKSMAFLSGAQILTSPGGSRTKSLVVKDVVGAGWGCREAAPRSLQSLVDGGGTQMYLQGLGPRESFKK